MSAIADEQPAKRAWPLFIARLRPALPLFAVVAAAIVLRLLIVTATDVSWLITLAEKVLDGRTLYVDLIEVNPPASILLYLTPVALSRLIGFAPEITVNAFVFLAAATSLWIAGRILSRAGLLDDIDGWKLAAFAAFLLLIFPARTFAQREHVAVILLLPSLSVYAARVSVISPGRVAAVIAGIGAGLAVSIKPHFAFAVILTAVAAAWHAKSWRLLFALEHWIAGSIVAVYGASIFIFYPQFISNMLPLGQTVYLPVRMSLLVILTRTPMILWLLSIYLLARQRPGALLEPCLSIPLVASCGFAVAYAVQGKGWPYQTYPMLTFSLLALAVFFSGRSRIVEPAQSSEVNWLAFLAISGLLAISSYWMVVAALGQEWPLHVYPALALSLVAFIVFLRKRVRFAAGPPKAQHSGIDSLALRTVALALVAAGFYWMTVAADFTALAQTIRLNVSHPKMLAISPASGLGHPLVRQVGGQWVQRISSLWITDYAEWLLRHEQSPPVAAALLRYAADDRAMLLEDIRRERPDIILLDTYWDAKTRADPDLSELLKVYSEIGRSQGIIILRRQQS